MKTLYRLAHAVRRIYWFFVRPRTRGVKCVIGHDGRWLLIRNTYGDHKRDTVYCYTSTVSTPEHKIDGVEVEEGRWFAPAEIPANHGSSIDRVLFMLSAVTR